MNNIWFRFLSVRLKNVEEAQVQGVVLAGMCYRFPYRLMRVSPLLRAVRSCSLLCIRHGTHVDSNREVVVVLEVVGF